MGDLVSIVVPIYNAAQYLNRCIASVVSQTYQNLEIILVDDGSADESGKICDAFALKDTRIVVIHQGNRGVSVARNVGVEQAVGKYIMFLDADDELLQDAVRCLYEAIKRDDADMAIGELVHCNHLNLDRREELPECKPCIDGVEFMRLVLEDHPLCYYACRILYHADLLKNIRFVEGCACGEDSYFVFCCALKDPRVSVVREVVYRYYTTEGSATRSQFSIKKYDDIIFFLNQKLQRIGTYENEEVRGLVYNLVVKTHMMILQNFCRSREGWGKREKESIKQVCQYKKQFFPATHNNKIWFFIISRHLYYPYKLLVKIFDKFKLI